MTAPQRGARRQRKFTAKDLLPTLPRHSCGFAAAHGGKPLAFRRPPLPPDLRRGSASPKKEGRLTGKAEPYRSVRRRSRKAYSHIGFGVLTRPLCFAPSPDLSQMKRRRTLP